MDITVSICTWNNSRRLAITLDALSRCSVPSGLKWELVLVNNNCADDTDAVVEGFRDRLPLVYLHEPKPGLSRARNTGLAVASGDLIIFTDDDVQPWPGWIAAYWAAYQDRGDLSYFGGPIESDFETSAPEPELLAQAPNSVSGMNYGDRARALKREEYFIGPNWACASRALREVRGFDPDKDLNPSLKRVHVGGETDLMKRLEGLGMSSWYVPGAGLSHFVPAEKCSLRHIASRAEAFGFERAPSYLDGRRRVMVRGIPLVMFKWTLGQWARSAVAWASGNKAYFRHYVCFWKYVGIMRGLHELR